MMMRMVTFITQRGEGQGKTVNQFRTPFDLTTMVDGLQGDLGTVFFDCSCIDDVVGKSFDEVRSWLRNMDGYPPHDLTFQEWHIITERGKFCNGKGCIAATNFGLMLRRQLAGFIQREASSLIESDSRAPPSQRAACLSTPIHFGRRGNGRSTSIASPIQVSPPTKSPQATSPVRLKMLSPLPPSSSAASRRRHSHRGSKSPEFVAADK